MKCKIYSIEGDFISEHKFRYGEPLVGDAILIRGWGLVYIYSRRWTQDGSLELIVNDEKQGQ